MVDRRRATGAQRDAQVAEDQYRPGHPGTGGEKHAHQRGDEHQQHHLWFGQFQIVAPACRAARLAECCGHGASPCSDHWLGSSTPPVPLGSRRSVSLAVSTCVRVTAGAGWRRRKLISTSTSSNAAPPPLWATATANGRFSSTLLMPRASCTASAASSNAASDVNP